MTGRRKTPLAALLILAIAVGGALLAAAPAGAARGLGVGFVDDRFGDNLLSNPNAAVRDKWFDRLADTNAGLSRINVYWNQSVGGSPPVLARNPADPSYEFGITDAAVRDAQERGLRVVLTVLGAPRWAQGPNPPPESEYRVGTWRPSGDRLEDFAAALATRYSGSFIDPDQPLAGPLPRVRFWEAWNEPNLPLYITPQWNGKKPQSPAIYRNLLNGFYRGIKTKPGNTVIAAGTSPFGDKRGGTRMRPYYFWREVFCLKNRKKLKKKKRCARGDDRAHLDIYAHNPINDPPDGPAARPDNADDGVPSNFKTLTRMVRKAEKKRTILPKKKGRKGWATEVWYESKPPEKRGVSLKKQARYMQQAMYVLWRQGAGAVFFLQLRDDTYNPNVPALVNFQTGVYFLDERPKPSLRAVQFPFVVDRVNKRKVRLWGKAPRSGRLVAQERKGKGYRRVARIRVREGKVFSKLVRLKGKGKLRAKVGREKSLTWKLR